MATWTPQPRVGVRAVPKKTLAVQITLLVRPQEWVVFVVQQLPVVISFAATYK